MMDWDRTITLRKRMAASSVREDGLPIQFLGSGYINRNPKGDGCSCSPDAAFVKNLLPDLEYNEGERGEIDVDCTISLDSFDGSVMMWCFGRRIESRCVSPHKPELVKIDNNPDEHARADTYRLKGSSFYLDAWCRNRYFMQHPAGDIFPVYVSVKRIVK